YCVLERGFHRSPHANQWGITADANAAGWKLCPHSSCATSLSVVFRYHIHRNEALLALAGSEGGRTVMRKSLQVWLPLLLISLATGVASAQSFRVQCPTSTITHPDSNTTSLQNPYNGPTQFTPQSQTAPGWSVPTANVNGGIKCQQVSGGDGYMTE